MPSSRPPLGRGFGRLATANAASSLATGVATTAAPLLAIRLTTDPLAVSGVAALSLLPWLLFAIPAGVIVDRIDRRLALAIAGALRVLLAATMLGLAATDSLSIGWLYAVVFGFAMAETLYDGAVRAVVPSLVPAAQLPRANGVIEVCEQVAQSFLAAPLTSLLLAVAVVIPLGANTVLFAVAGGIALALPRGAAGRAASDVRQFAATTPADAAGGFWAQFASGFRFIRGNRTLLVLWLFSSFVGFCYATATSNVALFAINGLGLPSSWFGVFLLTGASGAAVGGLLAGRLAGRFGTGVTMAVADLASNALIMVPGIALRIWVLAVVFVLSSAAVSVWNVLVVSLRQSMIPTGLLGRVHGTWRTLLWGCMPLGSVVGGLLGRVQLGVPFWAAGGAATVASLLFFRFLRGLPDPSGAPTPAEPIADEMPEGRIAPS